MRIELGKLTTFETASRDLLRVRDGDTVKVDLDEWKGYEYRVQGNVTRASGNTQVNLAVTRTCCRCEDLMHCGCVFARAGDGTGVWRKKEGCTFHFRSDLTDPVCTDCRPAEAHFSQLLLVSRPYYDEQDQAQLDYWLDQAQATCARPVQRMHELRSERKGMTAEHVSEVRRLHAQIRHLVEGVNALPRMADAMRPPARSMEETDRLARRWREVRRPLQDVTEFRDTLRELGSSKTSGESGITREHLLYAPDWVLETLLPIVNSMLTDLPLKWAKRGVEAPLGKSDTATRPIILGEVLFKLVSYRMQSAILDLLAEFKLLDPAHRGVVRNGSTTDALESINTVYQHALARERQVWVATCDAKSAFDSVAHCWVVVAVARLGAPDDVCECISSD